MAFTAAAIRVLLVEPHDDTRDLYRLWMARLGWEVLAATDGASAICILGAAPPDIVVTEMRLPDRGEAALLAAAAAAGVPVIGLTTAPRNQRLPFSPALAALVLSKPCSPDEIVTGISALLGSSLGGC